MHALTTRGTPPAEPPLAGRPRTILVVDDEPDVVSTLQALLEAGLPNAVVVGATNATEALALLDLKPDIVIADYRLPDGDGIQVLAAARERAPGAARVLITAYADTVIAIRAVQEAGVDRFIPKPWEARKLLEDLDGLLRERRREALRDAAFERSREEVRRRAERGTGPPSAEDDEDSP